MYWRVGIKPDGDHTIVTWTMSGKNNFIAKCVGLFMNCFLYTSARRYNAMGKGAVFRLYVRNFVSEVLHHRPKDSVHLDVRI